MKRCMHDNRHCPNCKGHDCDGRPLSTFADLCPRCASWQAKWEANQRQREEEKKVSA